MSEEDRNLDAHIAQKGEKLMKNVREGLRLRSSEYYYGGRRLTVRYHRSATDIEAYVSLRAVAPPNEFYVPPETTEICSVEEAEKIRKAFLAGVLGNGFVIVGKGATA